MNNGEIKYPCCGSTDVSTDGKMFCRNCGAEGDALFSAADSEKSVLSKPDKGHVKGKKPGMILLICLLLLLAAGGIVFGMIKLTENNSIVGKWQSGNNTFQFNDDGTFTLSAVDYEGLYTGIEGTYTKKGGKLSLDTTSGSTIYKCSIKNGKELTLTLTGADPVTYERISGKSASDETTAKDTDQQTAVPLLSEITTDVSVGSYLRFGKYEQDNDAGNGKEDIEWLVLAKDGNKALVISRYALDCQPYNTAIAGVTWETCTLRAWLNDPFYNTAFDGDESSLIIRSAVSADKNPDYDTDPGNATEDNVFLLSTIETDRYFNGNEAARICVPTAYAKSQGAASGDRNTASGEAPGWWWLRSPGITQFHAIAIGNLVSFSQFGNYSIDVGFFGVRPAMWISLES